MSAAEEIKKLFGMKANDPVPTTAATELPPWEELTEEQKDEGAGKYWEEIEDTPTVEELNAEITRWAQTWDKENRMREVMQQRLETIRHSIDKTLEWAAAIDSEDDNDE